ncbi:MAG TPA: Uma2 family endonuclease [Polyangiaceae bacterium]|nr:Uma2 family endonuclease [Polyangiaceae bacterium]
MQSHDAFPVSSKEGVIVQHRVVGFSDRWLIGETVPESAWHDHALEMLKAILAHWIGERGRDAALYRDLAVRVSRDQPRVGFNPDLMVVEPAPPGAGMLSSLKVWEPGHAVPSLAIEVVSPGHPYKDYVEIPDQCAAVGVGELIVFDPLLVGPKARGGPQRIQIWRRTSPTAFERVVAGDGPYRSAYLDAYLVAVEDGMCLRVADDELGKYLWPTPAEAAQQALATERAAAEGARSVAERERAAAERERAAADAARARIAELEEELRKRR